MLLCSFFLVLQTPKFLTVVLATRITFSGIVSHICTRSSLFLSHSAFNPGIPRLSEWFIFSLYPLRCNLLCYKVLYIDKCTVSCIPSCSPIRRSSAAWKRSLYFTHSPPLSLPTLAAIALFTISMVLPSPECHAVEIIGITQDSQADFVHLIIYI